MQKSEVIEAIKYMQKYKTETNKLEAKTALGGFPKKCYDTISSFSNKFGGLIIFGVNEENNFAVEGVYNVNDLQKQISSLCSDSMIPSVRADILPMEYDGKNIVAVKIDEIAQNKKPCYYKSSGLKNGSYTRIGDKDDHMTDYEIYALESYNDHIFEDTRPTKRASLDDLNKDSISEYVNKIKTEKPNFAKNDFDKCLKLCGITDTNNDIVYPTLAGTMIFGEYPQSFYPQLFVACVVVPGTELGDTGNLGERFIDNKRIEGTIEQMLEGTMNFLKRNMKNSVIINELGIRSDRTEYPLEALREAIANALIHRDYSTQTENAYISVYMYNDRIEIINPGTLYGTNKLEKLGTATTMESRNPTLVRILEEKGSVIENRHSGIPTMKREMKKYGLPEPEFYEERDSFKVVFRNNDSISNQVTSQVSGQVSGQVSDQVGDQVKRNQKLVLDYCVEPKSMQEIRKYLGMNSRSYVREKIIMPLIEQSLLEYTNKEHLSASNQKYITIRK
ncbi:MAG: putative DNA binding domain-containing protein [Bacilli bacterium]|nr:putative DNA binding domain-containing protein [Bacilli bacterium]